MKIEDFKKLSREDMFIEIVKTFPSAAKGKTRANKAKLIETYEGLLSAEKIDIETTDVSGTVIVENTVRCTCDDFCDDPCPVHADAMAAQDRRIVEQNAQIVETAREKSTWVQMEDKAFELGKKEFAEFGRAVKQLGGEVVKQVHDEIEIDVPGLPLALMVYDSVDGSIEEKIAAAEDRFFAEAPTETQRASLSVLLAFIRPAESPSGRLLPRDLPKLKTGIPMGQKTWDELKDEMQPVLVEADYSDIERHVVATLGGVINPLVDLTPADIKMKAAMGLGGVQVAVSQALDAEKGVPGPPPNTAILVENDQPIASLLSDVPVGIVVSRRVQVQRLLVRLGKDKLRAIAQYKMVPKQGNRKVTRRAQALKKKALKVLPPGVTIDEAMAVLS